MVNMQPGGQGEQQWYPRLPEGYEGNPSQGMQGYGTQGWPPGMGMPGQGMQGFPSGQGGQGYAMPGFPPGQGGQGYGMPGYPPGQGFGMPDPPGQGGQGFGMPGFPPGQGGQGFGGPGFSPGQGGPGFEGPGFPPGQGGPGFGRPGFPPGQGGPGFGGPGFPPGQGGPGQQQRPRTPTSAPPNRIPEYPSSQLFAVDPGAIRGCLFRYTFIWTSRRQGFWFFPVFVGRTSVAGYRWRSRQRRWEYMGMDLNQIDRFTC